ncbi:MAG: hypothetical protein JWR55_700 [Aeromicrobium sp.]|jgi:uncharacterized protein (TIGR02118 family)|nr:hypothetical protein [Aeromicrobium sp.]
MYDVIVLYRRPADPVAFDRHYVSTHVPLVRAMPLLTDFTWGPVVDAPADGFYYVARMSYATSEDAATSLGSPEGAAAVADLDEFAGAGVEILNVAVADRE